MSVTVLYLGAAYFRDTVYINYSNILNIQFAKVGFISTHITHVNTIAMEWHKNT